MHLSRQTFVGKVMSQLLIHCLDLPYTWRRAWQPTAVFLPGESPWTEESGRLQSMGSQRVRHD